MAITLGDKWMEGGDVGYGGDSGKLIWNPFDELCILVFKWL